LENNYLSQKPDERLDFAEKDSLIKVLDKMQNVYQKKYDLECPIFEDVTKNRFVYSKINLYFTPQDNTVMLITRHSIELVKRVINEVKNIFPIFLSILSLIKCIPFYKVKNQKDLQQVNNEVHTLKLEIIIMSGLC
jgi:hypothetical protein